MWLLALAMLLASPAFAQSYPSSRIRIIVPFGAGGPADIYARVIAHHLSQTLKQSFVIENRPGGGAVIGTTEAARAAPDGYTLLMGPTGSVRDLVFPAVKKNLPFDTLSRDFVTVSNFFVNYANILVVVHPSVPAKTVAEFIALLKAKPGELNYASSGPGTPYHLAGENFKSTSGTSIVHVPHQRQRRSAQQRHRRPRPDDDGRRDDDGADDRRGARSPRSRPPVRSRSSVLPNVPTAAEAGLPGFEATIWLGIMAPAGTPQPIVDLLNAEIAKVVALPEVKDAWTKQGATGMTMSPAEFKAYIEADIVKWAKVIETAKITVK